MSNAGDFAAVAVALYAAHHVGDYWVQRDVDAQHKGDAGLRGQLHCLVHVLSYVLTQVIFMWIMTAVTHLDITDVGAYLGLAVSGVTHYIADRRTPLIRIAGWVPGKADFLKLGVPRAGAEIPIYPEEGSPAFVSDNPQLATGAWALDQSWHIFWGVFVAALIMVGVR